MRPQLNLRAPASLAAAGVLLIGMTEVRNARADAPAQGGSAPVGMSLSDATLTYGELLLVRGRVDPSRAGEQLALQHRARGEDWRVLRTGPSGADGRYRFSVRPDRSGDVRVTLASTAAAARDASTSAAADSSASSQPRAVSVAASIAAPRRPVETLAGRNATLRGVLRPARAGRLVVVESGGRLVARTRTNGRGAFRLRWRASRAGMLNVGVRFRGDAANAAVTARKTVNVFRLSFASWYSDGGATACGRHARFGVAHRTLPCGTKVTVRYHGRSVVATVDDRGPFVGGRDWDLNGAVAGRLRFDGTDSVWVTA